MSDRFAPDRLLRRFAALPEHAMRVAIWREVFSTCTPDAIVQVIERILAALDQGTTGGKLAYLALIHLAVSDDGRRAVRDAASEPRIRGLFGEMPEPLQANPSELRGPPLDPDRTVPLGERVSWARRPDRQVIERLMFDPSDRVIGKLLNNPKVTEADVLRIASRRPTPATSLEQVFAHPRWGLRIAVQEALILNPYTPLRIACGLVGVVDAPTARRIARQPAAHPLVRAAARARLNRP